MDLLTYAVSQKLRKGVDMWELVHQGKDVPISIIESAFAETLDTFKDDVAERLVKNYNSYISYDVPVTMVPEIGGMVVRGHLDDVIPPIVEVLHGKTKDAVVTDVITRAVRTINPTRKIDVTDIVFSETVEKFAESVALNHAILEQIDKPQQIVRVTKPEPKVDMDEPVRVEPVKKDMDLSSAYAALEDADMKYHQYDTGVSPDLETPILVDLDTPSDVANSTVVNGQIQVDKTDSKDVESVEQTTADELTELGILKSVWNSFIDDMKSKELDERMEFTTPLTYAL